MDYETKAVYSSNVSCSACYTSQKELYSKKSKFKGVCNRTCITIGKCTCK